MFTTKLTLPTHLLLIISSLITILSSCGGYYSANSLNVPLMEEKGDLKLQSGIAMSEELMATYKIENNAAYAFTNHFAGMLNTCLYLSTDYDF